MDPETILREIGLSKTRSRVQILKLMGGSTRPLSGSEIFNRLSGRCDRSTVYRTLNVLFEREVIQRVLIDHEVKFALRENHASDTGPGEDHIHFKCMRCEVVYCLKDLVVGDYALPEGFEKSENQFLIIGTCRSCKTTGK